MLKKVCVYCYYAKIYCFNVNLIVNILSFFPNLTVAISDDNFEEALQDKTATRKHRRRKLIQQEEITCNTINYPVDVWFHISRYIKPEQIKLFASICHASWSVTKSSQFWLTLYQKYVKSDCNLPTRLQPWNIDAGPGIQCRVVRALYQTYTPFKLKATAILDHSTELPFKKCVNVWWEKEYSAKKGAFVWTYYFKVASIDDKETSVKRVLHNPERNKIVVKVKCLNYIKLQPVLGMILTSFNLCMSGDMRYHQVKLTFHHERRDKKYNRNQGMLLVMNPVIDMNILHWWTPNYPSCND